ncbi:MAG TPA: hypothetical protein VH255_07615 [Verrucomicrobiae bacterium]|jgi:hypothetical protein|nr:hypothetical protein [Verrucomicrobiae bacterium]
MNIKSLMVLGSLVGFVTATSFGIANGCPWPDTLWRASVAALIIAVLTRWWGGIWANSLRDALRQRQNQPPPSTAKPVAKP